MLTFLTAYDPLDLPGTSIDPLGFERGYLLLADKILPGMTNVASRPRYFSLLCAGSRLTPPVDHLSPQQRKAKRQDCVKRLERFWVLANLLAADDDLRLGEEALYGIRGVRYVKSVADKLTDGRATRADAKFPMLVRQAPYGVIGIYGAVAEGLRLLSNRKDLSLTPDLGETLADGFLTETQMPRELRVAVADDGTVSTQALRDWGRKAHIAGNPTTVEKAAFDEITFRQLGPRSRMAALAQVVTHLNNEQETELGRLARMAARIEKHPREDQDLLDAIRAILAYERAYRLLLLGFERLLWKCKHCAAIADRQLENDEVLMKVRKRLPQASKELAAAIELAQTPAFRSNLERLQDAVAFVHQAAQSTTSTSPSEFLDALLARHCDVQHGKFDQGRRKLPWVERRNGLLCLTLTQVGRATEVTREDQILPHFYRLGTLDAFLRYARFTN